MIERLYVHNFRCLENFTLEFSGRPSALLLGKNGAGKSTVRHALALVQGICRGASRVRDLISQKDFSFGRTKTPMRFELRLRLGERRFDYAIAFTWPDDFREARIEQESLSVDGNSIFSRDLAQVTMADAAPFNVDWHVVALPVIHERGGENAVQQLRSFFRSMMLLSPVPQQMSGFAEEDSSELAADASNIAACFVALLKKKPAAYGHIESHIKGVLPDFSSLENVPRGERGNQLMIHFQEGEPARSLTVDFKDLSDGEKCFFLCALLVAWHRADGPIFCFWDEPDNHLSLAEVGHFVTTLRKIANQRSQFIATSHHPEVIRKFSDETTLILTRKTHLDPAVPRTLAEFPYNGDLIDALVRGEIVE